jgi:hypothetical protein
MKLLHGHDSPESAFLQFDYPFGRRIRCVQRYWVETSTSGAKRGQQRLVSQTTHKVFNVTYTEKIDQDGIEAANTLASELINDDLVAWNAPKGSVYAEQVLMYVAPLESGPTIMAVHHDAVSAYRGPDDFERIRRNWFDQMDERQRSLFTVLMIAARRISPSCWAAHDAKLAAAIPSSPIQ